MQQKRTQQTTRKGFTLIEGLILLFIFVVGVLAFYNLFTLGTFHIIEAKKRLTAVAFANERIEHFRNFPYDSISLSAAPVIDHSPSGGLGTVFDGASNIARDETVTVSNVGLRVLADVHWIDDPDDGTASDTDIIPTDYKTVYITVLWGDAISCSNSTECQAEAQSVEISAQFVPPGGLETPAGDGALSINVLNSDGTPVVGADVEVYNASFTPDPYHVILQTDIFGNATFLTGATAESGGMSDLEPALESYEVTVSKAESGRDYETVATEIPFNDATAPAAGYYEPTYGHQSVFSGTLTKLDVVTDIVADFTVLSVTPFCDSVPSIPFDVEGGRIKGTIPSTGDPVYVHDESLITDTNGERLIRFDTNGDGSEDSDDGASVGEYNITMTDTDYEFWRLDPGDDLDPNKIIVLSNADLDCNMIIIQKTGGEPDAFFIRVYEEEFVDGVTVETPVEEASVRLRDIATAYDEEQEVDQYGYVYFPINENEPLTNLEDYTISVSADGYDSYTSPSPEVVDGFTPLDIELTLTP